MAYERGQSLYAWLTKLETQPRLDGNSKVKACRFGLQKEMIKVPIQASSMELKLNSQKKLRIGHLSTFYHTSFILMGLGWVEDRLGVRASWHLFGGGPAIVEALDRGEVDIGYVGLPPVIIGIDRGAKIKCIAGGHVEGTVFLAGKAFKSLEELGSIRGVLEQLKGKGIGVPPRGSIHDVILRGLIQEEGLEGITIRNYPWADFVLEAMLDGEVDAAVGTPALAVASSQAIGARILIPPNKIWPNNPSYGIITTTKMIQETPDVLEGFLRLHEEASALIRMSPRRAARAISDMVGIIDEDFVLETYRISPKYCASLSNEYIKASLAFIPLLKKLKYIHHTLNQEDIFYPKLIEKVHPEPPHYEVLKINP